MTPPTATALCSLSATLLPLSRPPSFRLRPPVPPSLRAPRPALLLLPRRPSPGCGSALRGRRLAPSGQLGAMAATKQVEHVVLFKVKPGQEEAASAMVAALADLEKLPGVLHLHVGPRLHPVTGQEGGGAWTHALYGRYESKEALQHYSDHPDHVAAVVEKVRPIADEVVALDWDLEEGGAAGADKAAGVVRVYLLELADEDAAAVLGQHQEKLKELQSVMSGVVRWASAGKNFAPARAKGHTWGFLVAFSDEDGLKRFSSDPRQKVIVEDGLLRISKKVAAIDFRPQSRL